jgi:hypothetical protein
MGLDLVVGVPPEDEDAVEWASEQFEAINRVLAARGILAHREPDEVPEGRQYEERVGGYGALHFLRRFAAHLEAKREIPPPCIGNPVEDPVLAVRYRRSGGRFSHLIDHSDAEGYYLPIDFADVIEPPDDAGVPGGAIGSSFALLRECEELARALGIPLDVSTEDVGNGDGSQRWHSYAAEARVCLVLHRAAATSIETGAAIVFC